MKKILLVLIPILFSINTFACAICGCGGTNVYFGLLPDFNNRFISLRYHHSQFHTQLANDPSQFSTNNYNSMELMAGYTLSKHFKLLAFVPYHFNNQLDDDGASTKTGLGDITLIGQYLLLNKVTGIGSAGMISHQLWVGGGIKIPTGGFHVDPSDSATTIADINAQLGTGSVDFLLNGSYTLSIGKWGLNASAAYKINTRNNNNYQYGNTVNINAILFYRVAAGRVTISPNIGMGYESVAGNQLAHSKVQYTGSHLTTALAGVEFAINRVGFGVSVQAPIAQNFAEGQTEMKWRGMAHVTLSF